MLKELQPISAIDRRRAFIAELASCNAYTARYGLRLSPNALAMLTDKREEALISTGRIEFGAGAVKKLVIAFADSPYMDSECYEEKLCDLIDAFFYFKNESLELISDDELIDYMRRVFDRNAGETEAVTGVPLERICRARRFGEEFAEEETEGNDDDEGYDE